MMSALPDGECRTDTPYDQIETLIVGRGTMFIEPPTDSLSLSISRSSTCLGQAPGALLW